MKKSAVPGLWWEQHVAITEALQRGDSVQCVMAWLGHHVALWLEHSRDIVRLWLVVSVLRAELAHQRRACPFDVSPHPLITFFVHALNSPLSLCRGHLYKFAGHQISTKADMHA